MFHAFPMVRPISSHRAASDMCLGLCSPPSTFVVLININLNSHTGIESIVLDSSIRDKNKWSSCFMGVDESVCVYPVALGSA